jgi:hypothetical protein
MQRLFSTFPAGGPGVALVLFRACVAAMFVLEAWPRVPAAAAAPGLLAGALATALLLGLATPLACLLCLAAEAVFAAQAFTPMTAIVLVEAVALALLGPGGYSVDGLLFGRRRLVWPAAGR